MSEMICALKKNGSSGGSSNIVYVGAQSNYGVAGGSGIQYALQILNTNDYKKYSKIKMSIVRSDAGMVDYGCTMQALNSSYVATGTSIALPLNTEVDVSAILSSGNPYISIKAGGMGSGTPGQWLVYKFEFN